MGVCNTKGCGGPGKVPCFNDQKNRVCDTYADLSAEERIARLLSSLSARFASRRNSSKEFDLSMSRRDIASNLRLATETISRVLARFQSAGIIKVNRKKVAILDKDKLRELAQCFRLINHPSPNWPFVVFN